MQEFKLSLDRGYAKRETLFPIIITAALFVVSKLISPIQADNTCLVAQPLVILPIFLLGTLIVSNPQFSALETQVVAFQKSTLVFRRSKMPSRSRSSECRRVDHAIESLDLNAAELTDSEAAIATLQSDIAALHGNASGLEPKKRASRLTTAMSLLSITQADQ